MSSMTMTVYRDTKGQFMQPTSTNSLDAGIPPEGRDSAIFAKNLLVGDRFMAASDSVYSEIRALAFDNKTGNSSDNMVYVTARNMQTGDVFLYAFGFYDTITIVETPERRRNRRNDSRVEFSDRYTSRCVQA